MRLGTSGEKPTNGSTAQSTAVRARPCPANWVHFLHEGGAGGKDIPRPQHPSTVLSHRAPHCEQTNTDTGGRQTLPSENICHGCVCVCGRGRVSAPSLRGVVVVGGGWGGVEFTTQPRQPASGFKQPVTEQQRL